jgi:glutathione S-transferase
MIVLHHGGPTGHSASVLVMLAEKRVAYEDRYVDLSRFEEHEEAFLALNPDGMVPLLVADGRVLTETAYILHYLEESFPEPRLDGASPRDRYRTHWWDKYVEGHLAPALAIVAGSKGAPAAAAAGVKRLPPERRALWAKALDEGFSADEIAGAQTALSRAVDEFERALDEAPWLGGEAFGMADILAFPHAERIAELSEVPLAARTIAWLERVRARPSVAAVIAGRSPDRAFALGPEAPRWG